jgi:hypothetical protein
MRILTFIFYLAAATFAFLVAKILLYSIRHQTSQQLRHQVTEHTLIPSGDRELHDVMVQFISEYEPQYLHCLLLEREYRKYKTTECHFGRAHVGMLRRFHKLRNEQEKDIKILQIGAMDGKSNDPLFLSMIQPHMSSTGKFWPPYAVDRLHAVLVEPVQIKALHKQYATFDLHIPDMNLSHFQFIEMVINDAKEIDSEGNCAFYKASITCPRMKGKKWISQISGLDPSPMKLIFSNDSDQCIDKVKLPCTTISGLLRSTGHDVVLQSPPAETEKDDSKWCRKTLMNTHNIPPQDLTKVCCQL